MTAKQLRAVNNLVANGGNFASAMRDAGYSPKTARNPKKLTGSPVVQEVIHSIEVQLESERQRALNFLSEKIRDARYTDLINAVESITKILGSLRLEKSSPQALFTEKEKERGTKAIEEFFAEKRGSS